MACSWISLEGSKPTLTMNKHGILLLIFLETKFSMLISIPERFSKFSVFKTKRLKELINLSIRHEAIRTIYWKLVKFPSFGTAYSHYGFLCHCDHLSELKLILLGRIVTKVLNFSFYFSSSQDGPFFSVLGATFPTIVSNYLSGIISSNTYFMITSPKSNRWDFKSPMEMLS